MRMRRVSTRVVVAHDSKLCVGAGEHPAAGTAPAPRSRAGETAVTGGRLLRRKNVCQGMEVSEAKRLAADRLLAKIRAFVTEQLDDEEAVLFAALVAPAVAGAYLDYGSGPGADVDWRPEALPDALVAAVRDGGIKVVGLT